MVILVFAAVIAVTCLDPGLSNCNTQIVLVNINGDDVENIHPVQQLGENAWIVQYLMHGGHSSANNGTSFLFNLLAFFFFSNFGNS